MPTRKPPLNILWIQTDEHRTDSLGCYGHPRIQTPNIDALAARGTVFRNHHTQSPVCVPSRVCELTSRYPHQTGILNNSVHYTWGRWPENAPAFTETFAQAGYVTTNLGKYHTPHHPTWLENWHFEWFPEEAGFTHLTEAFDAEAHELIHIGHNQRSVILSGRYPEVHNGRTPQTYLTDHALDWLRMYGHVRRPFLLRVSYLAPHTPVLAPEPFYSMYDPDDMDWDVPTEAVLGSRPRYEAARQDIYRVHTDAEFRRMRCTYYGLVSHIDQQVGRLLDCLTQQGLMDNTLVVFTADHGDLMGEYGQFQKGMFYDITTRVPCILAGPGIAQGQRVTRLTEGIDLAPTLLEQAGLSIPKGTQGQNMFTSARDDVIGEICLRRDRHWARRSWIRTKRWSLDFTSEIDDTATNHAEARDGKLIDLEADPLAHENLYTDPAYADIVTALQRRFFERTSRDRRPIQHGGNPYV